MTSHFIKIVVNLTHVFDCYESFAKEYKDKSLLNEEEFDDIFSPLLNDTKIYFDKLQVCQFYNLSSFYSRMGKQTFTRRLLHCHYFQRVNLTEK